MLPNSHTRTVVIAGAWIATSAIAFSLGKLGNPVSRPPIAAAHGSQGVGRELGSATAQASTNPGGSESFQSVASRGGAEDTVQGVTGGEPLEDWLKRLMTQDDEILRTSGFLKLMEALKSPEEIQQALDAINSIGGRNRWRGGVGMREGSMLLQKWTQLDPKGAMGYAQSQKGEQEKWGATTVIMRTWARINPDEAIAYAKETAPPANPQDGNWSIAAVVGQLAKTDLDRAMQLSSTEDVSRARARMMESVLDELVSQRG
ncbi:MAG TPA: hypothetical protein VFG14_04270, partial [Chthoniobacteraceae bacterium]|nr:hypothetical protein [Chthoniobacteraceae bacterium]